MPVVFLLAVAACQPAMRQVHPEAEPASPVSATHVTHATHAADTADSRRGRFYRGQSYGSERQFNPVTQLLNEGFDLLRGTDVDRRVLQLPYGVTARNVVSSVQNAPAVIRGYGVSRFVRHELLPLSTKAGGGGGWVPNYQFHLLGSGMVTAKMREWFIAHDVPYPAVASAGVMMASHVLNEMTERAGPRSADAVADLLIFDPLGILLSHNATLQRLLRERVTLTNWPLQPVLTAPDLTLENTGQQFVLRTPLPGSRQWRGLYMFGVSTLFGVSRQLREGYAVSLGVGADAVRITVLDSLTDRRTVDLRPNAGLFFDREGSLLASLLIRLEHESLATLNIYPGVRLWNRTLPVGLFVGVRREGGVRVGVAGPFGFGIGIQ